MQTAPRYVPTRSSEVRRVQLRSRRLVTGDLMGQYRSAFRGTGLVFTDIREYQPGDDVKHIHWKATARTGKVFVKSYEEDRQLRVLLAIDASASMRAVDSVSAFNKALEFTSLIGALTAGGNDLLGLSLFGTETLSYLPPKSGAKRIQQILAALMGVDSSTLGTDIGAGLHQVSLALRKPSIVFVLSDFFSSDFEDRLRTLSAVHDVILVQLESSLGAVEESGLVSFIDAESGARVVVDTSNKSVRAAWEENLQQRRTTLHEMAQRAGADHIVISDNALRPLLGLMKERARRISR
jgi:uncharacterized protein (DUF58 family)